MSRNIEVNGTSFTAVTATEQEGVIINYDGTGNPLYVFLVAGGDNTEINLNKKADSGVVDEDAVVINMDNADLTGGSYMNYALNKSGNVSVYGNVVWNINSGNLFFTNATADQEIIGGAYSGGASTVFGNITMNIGDGVSELKVGQGGNLIGGGASVVNGSTSLVLKNVADADPFTFGTVAAGAAWGGEVKGDASVDIQTDVTAESIFGGSYNNTSSVEHIVGGKSSVAISGAGTVVTVTDAGKGKGVFGGSLVRYIDKNDTAAKAVSATSEVSVTDGAKVVGDVFGGGYAYKKGSAEVSNSSATAEVTGLATVFIAGGTVDGSVYGGGKSDFDANTFSTVGSTDVTLSGATVTKWVVGGGMNGDVLGDTNLLIESNSSVPYIIGGSRNGNVDGNITTTINGADKTSSHYEFLVGGCYWTDTAHTDTVTAGKEGEDTTIATTVANSTVDTVFGGSKALDAIRREGKKAVVNSNIALTLDNADSYQVLLVGETVEFNGSTAIADIKNGSQIYLFSITEDTTDVNGDVEINIAGAGTTVTHLVLAGAEKVPDAWKPAEYVTYKDIAVNNDVSVQLTDGGTIGNLYLGTVGTLTNVSITGDISVTATGGTIGAIYAGSYGGGLELNLSDTVQVTGAIDGGADDNDGLAVLNLSNITLANDISGFDTITIDGDVVYTGTSISTGEIIGVDGSLTLNPGTSLSVTTLKVGTLTLTGTDGLAGSMEAFSVETVDVIVAGSLDLGSYTLVSADLVASPSALKINGGESIWRTEGKQFELVADSTSITLNVTEIEGPFIESAAAVQETGAYNFSVTVNGTGDGVRYTLSGDDIVVDPNDPLKFSIANTIRNTTVTVTATDAYGRTATHNIGLVVTDYTNPVLETSGISQKNGTYEFTVMADGSDNFGVTERLYRWATTADGLAGSGASTGTKLILSDADAARTYYYQVMLKDAAGNTTGWSEAAAFTVQQVVKPGDSTVLAPDVTVTPDPDHEDRVIRTGTTQINSTVSKEDTPKETYKVLTDTAAATSISIDGLEAGEKIRVSVVDANGKKLKSITVTAKKNGVAAINNFLTPSGDTFIQVESLTKKTAIDYNMKVTQNYFEEPSKNSTVETAEKIVVTETPSATKGWVGYGDSVDTYKFETGAYAGALQLNVSELDAKVKITLRDEHNKVVKSMTVTASNFDKKGFTNIYLNANTTTYLYIESGDKGKGKQNAYYNLSSSMEEFSKATNDSLLDPTKVELGSRNTGWVGYSDAADFYQFSVAEGATIGLNLTGLEDDYKAGKQVKVTLYNQTTGKKVKLKSVKNDLSMNFITSAKNGLDAGNYCAVVSISNEKKYRSDYTIGIASV